MTPSTHRWQHMRQQRLRRLHQQRRRRRAAAQVVRMEVALEAAQEWEAEKELMLHLTKCRIAELEREERANNEPMRAKLCAAAETAWGPDHAARPSPGGVRHALSGWQKTEEVEP